MLTQGWNNPERCDTCGRATVAPVRGPRPVPCSRCEAERWTRERRFSVAEVGRRAKAYLDARWPERAERRAKLMDRATGGKV